MGRMIDVLGDATAEVQALEAERNRLQNAVTHLLRSNDELSAEQRGGDTDPELGLALTENESVIDKYRQQIQQIEDELSQQEHYQVHSQAGSNLTSSARQAHEQNASRQHDYLTSSGPDFGLTDDSEARNSSRQPHQTDNSEDMDVS